MTKVVYKDPFMSHKDILPIYLKYENSFLFGHLSMCL